MLFWVCVCRCPRRGLRPVPSSGAAATAGTPGPCPPLLCLAASCCALCGGLPRGSCRAGLAHTIFLTPFRPRSVGRHHRWTEERPPVPRDAHAFTVSNVSFAQLNAGFYSRKQKFTLMNRSKARTWCCTRGGSGWGQAEGSLCPRPRQHTPPAGLSGGTSRQRGTMVQTAGRRSVTGQECRQPSAALSEEGRKTAVGVSPLKRRSWNLQQAQLSCLLPETCQDCQQGEENRSRERRPS